MNFYKKLVSSERLKKISEDALNVYQRQNSSYDDISVAAVNFINGATELIKLMMMDKWRGIHKNINDIIKPYKSSGQVKKELFQVLYGLSKVFFSLIGILTAVFLVIPVAIIVVPIAYWMTGISNQNRKSLNLSLFKYFALDMMNKILDVFAGALQIVTWPLVLIRMPVRSIITLSNDPVLIEDSRSLRDLLSQFKAKKSFGSQCQIYKSIIGKYENACNKKQKTNINKNELDECIKRASIRLDIKSSRYYSGSNLSTVIAFFEEKMFQRDMQVSEQSLSRWMSAK